MSVVVVKCMMGAEVCGWWVRRRLVMKGEWARCAGGGRWREESGLGCGEESEGMCGMWIGELGVFGGFMMLSG